MHFNNDFYKAMELDRLKITEKGRYKNATKEEKLKEFSERDILKEMQKLKSKYLDTNISFTPQQLRIAAENSLLNKLEQKLELAEKRTKDNQYIDEHNKIFALGSRDNFPCRIYDKIDYLKETIRIAGKTHPDNNTITKDEIASANRFLQNMYAYKGVVVANFKDEKQNLFLSQTFSTQKIQPKKENTTTLAELLINMGSVENLDVYLRSGTFFYNQNQTYTENTMNSLYNMVIDIDDCPLSDFSNKQDAYEYVLKKYPILSIIKPDYIIDTGNKGFHIIYLLHNNALNYKAGYLYILKLLCYILHADMSKCTLNGSTRMPYTKNSKGTRTRIVYERENISDDTKLNFTLFAQQVVKYAKTLYISKNHTIYTKAELYDIYHLNNENEFNKMFETQMQKQNLFQFYSFFSFIYSDWDEINKITNNYRTSANKKDGKIIGTREHALADIQRSCVIDKYSKTSQHGTLTKAQKEHYEQENEEKRQDALWLYKLKHYYDLDIKIKDEDIKFKPTTYIANRLYDLETYLKRHEYDILGKRNNFMALYCATLFLAHHTKDDVWNLLQKVNKSLGVNALRESELRATYRYALKCVNRKQFYKLRYSDARMVEMLDLTDKDFLYMRNRYTREAKEEYYIQKRTIYNEQRRKARGFNEKQKEKISMILKALRKYGKENKKYLVKLVSQETGIPKSTVYWYINRFSLLSEIEKQTKSSKFKHGYKKFSKHIVKHYQLSPIQYVSNYVALFLLKEKQRIRHHITVNQETVLAYKQSFVV